MCCHFLFRGSFPTQGSNPHLLYSLHWQLLTWNQVCQEELQIRCRRNLPVCQEQISRGGGVVAKSCPTLAPPWTIACQAPLSMGFFRQEYWSGLPFPFPGDLRNPGIEHESPALQADSLPKSHGQRSEAGYSPLAHKRVGYDLVTKQQQHLPTSLRNYQG